LVEPEARNRPLVFYSIGVTSPITPEEPLPPEPAIPRGAIVVLEGRAPIWRYGMALHLLHGSPAAAVAVYDPRLGAVIVASHHPDIQVGTVLPVEAPAEDAG
jgi:CRISPR-associated protein Csx3